jgi:hypothetical protein
VAGEALSKGSGVVRGFFTEVGTMMILTARTLSSAVRPPYPYGEELADQVYFTLRLCWFPLLISTFALCLGAPGLQAAGPLQLFATLFSNASVTDLWGSVLMCTMFGAIIAIVCSYKGMTASGGAAGVGRAVNQAVVIAMVGVFAFNYVFTAVLLATNPELQAIR